MYEKLTIDMITICPDAYASGYVVDPEIEEIGFNIILPDLFKKEDNDSIRQNTRLLLLTS